jgi:(p)ppGpp synthase/HD superfamily hydrolase
MDQAIALAVDSFRDIFRKGTSIPYLTHLMSVAAMVGEGGGDEEQIIAAMLHDYIEDIPGATADELEQQFGKRVATLVVKLSDSTTQPKPPWRERKETYLKHLEHEAAEVKLISVADKLHNCRSLIRDHLVRGDATYERFTGKKDGTLWYYRSLLPALAHQFQHPLLDELYISVETLHRISKVPYTSSRSHD